MLALTMKCPGKPHAHDVEPHPASTSMVSTDSVIGMPSLRSRTSFRQELRGS